MLSCLSCRAACEVNNAGLVAALLNHGAAVNTHCLLGWTALQEAMCRDNVEIGEMLLKAGAKLNLTNVYGISPLFTAAQSGQLAALRFLIKHGEPPPRTPPPADWRFSFTGGGGGWGFRIKVPPTH